MIQIKMKRLLLLVVFLSFKTFFAYAQTLSQPSAIQIAQQQSYNMMVARLSFMSHYWSYRSFRAEMLHSQVESVGINIRSVMA